MGAAHPEGMTTKRIWLGLIAALSIAACSSKDPLLNGHGGGGGAGNAGIGGQAGNAVSCDGGAAIFCTDGVTIVCSLTACPTGTAGTGGGAGRGGTGGTAGASGTGGATGGTAGASGGGGTVGAAGAGGTGGAAGRGGTGGVAGASGGAPGGRGGAGGTTGAGGTGGRVDGGTDARACELSQCIRAYICIRACGGPIVTNNCCPCEPPLFDDFQGMACGDGGTGATSYVGCRFVGGLDRVVVAKRDTSRNLCVNVVFVAPRTPSAGLTLPSNYGLESVGVVLPSECPTRNVPSAAADSVMGTAAWTNSASPSTADVDLVVTLPGNDEALIARNVDISPACQ